MNNFWHYFFSLSENLYAKAYVDVHFYLSLCLSFLYINSVDTDADGSVEVERGLLNSDIIGRDQHLEWFHLANIGKYISWQLIAWRSSADVAGAPLRWMRGQNCRETFGVGIPEETTAIWLEQDMWGFSPLGTHTLRKWHENS